jgi:2-dehydropantoate 2-reductase
MTSLGFSGIFILGAGAIGSAFGAALSTHYGVTLIGSKPHVDAINSKGLSVSGDIRGTFHVKVDTRIRSIPEETLIVLTTKVHDSFKAIEGIKNLLKKDTTILILQNGLGNEDIVRSIAGKQIRVLRGVLKASAEFSAPGEIRFWMGKTIIGQGKGAPEIVAMLNRCGLEARLSDNIAHDVWKKLVVNCVVNPLTAILRVRDGEIITDSLAPVRSEIVNECIAIAKAEGVTLSADLGERIDRNVAGYRNFSSMYQDIVRGRRTEIDFLNGKIVELGKKHSISAPVNATLTGLIKHLEGQNAVPRED